MHLVTTTLCATCVITLLYLSHVVPSHFSIICHMLCHHTSLFNTCCAIIILPLFATCCVFTCPPYLPHILPSSFSLYLSRVPSHFFFICHMLCYHTSLFAKCCTNTLLPLFSTCCAIIILPIFATCCAIINLPIFATCVITLLYLPHVVPS